MRRAYRGLAAARHLAEGGFFEAAVSRAYFAAFHAAETAIESLGETRTKHSGVISAFHSLIVRSGAVDKSLGSLLRSLFEDRNEADYGVPSTDAVMAEDAIARAERVVEDVADWLGRQDA